jgi:predicted DNA-binding transcriptional regulator AlpA
MPSIPRDQRSPYPGRSPQAAAGGQQPLQQQGGSTSARGPPSGEQLLPIEDVTTRTSLSRSEIYRRIALGEFPRPIRLSGSTGSRGGRVAFVASEIDVWIAARVAEWREANP